MIAFDILLALHLIGLMMGAGGGFGSMITQREAATRSPEQAATLKSLGPAMVRFSAIGLVIMLATGFALVFVKYQSLGDLPLMFWIKMLFVTTLTLASILVHLTYAKIKAGDFSAASRLAILGPASGMSSLLAVIFAVFAFH
ncbi:hypothetical protein [Vitreimonas sp.]|uniref:hypothetical protein n=1 Tax=Vitreimonas sp. TaxID=3069702 RepID=UPI002EDB4805